MCNRAGTPILALVFIFCLTSATCARTLIMQLNGITIGIDEQTGGIISLSHQGPGAILAATPESSGLVELAYPLESFEAMRLATRFSKARITTGDNEITIVWDNLGPSRRNPPLPEGNVSAQVKLKAAPNGRSVILSCHIENHSQTPIPQIIFPDLWGMRAFGGDEQTKLYAAGGSSLPFSGPVTVPLSVPFYAKIGETAHVAPKSDPDAMRKVELTGADGGMTVVCSKDARLPDRLFTYRKEASPGSMRLLWEHQDKIEPGQSWDSGEYWLTLYSGERLNGLPRLRKLTMNGLEMSIDDETGNIVRMAHPATGVIMDDPDGIGGLVEVSTSPMMENGKMLSSKHSKARIEQSDSTYKLIWEDLVSSEGKDEKSNGRVGAEVTISPASDGRSTIMSCIVRNGLDVPVRLARFPDLMGFRPVEGRENTSLTLPRLKLQPFTSNYDLPIEHSPQDNRGGTSGWKDLWAGGYYQPLALRWLDYGGYKSGISMFQRRWWKPSDTIKDHLGRVVTYRESPTSDSLRIIWEHGVEIKPGQTWSSGEFWLTPHEGGWAKGIEVFRDYVWQVREKRRLPSHVRDGLGFLSIWMRQSWEPDPEKVAFKYKDLPAVAADAKAHGIDELVLWGWCRYLELPIPTSDLLGTREEFLAGLKAAEQLGVNVSLFTNLGLVHGRFATRYEAPEPTPYIYHKELIPMYGANYAVKDLITRASMESKLWLQDAEDALSQWISLGVTSFCLDLWTPTPELVSMMSRLRTAARAKNRESTLSGESLDEFRLETNGDVLDYTWNWVDEANSDPIISVLRSPRLNYDVDGPMAAKMAFMCGNYLNVFPRKPDQINGTSLISEIPELSKAVKECTALRRQFLDYFVNGNLIGDSVLEEPTSGFVRGHVLGDRMLVFVLNDKDRAQTIKVKSNLGLWLPKAGSYYEVESYDSSGRLVNSIRSRGTHWSATTKKLTAGELTMFVIRAVK